MLQEASIANTKDISEEFTCFVMLKPETESTTKAIIAIFKYKIVKFFEKISTPLILETASKLANLIAFFLTLFNEIIWKKIKIGIANSSIKYSGREKKIIILLSPWYNISSSFCS